MYFSFVKPFELFSFILSGALFVYFSLFPDVDTDSKVQNATYLTLFMVVMVLIILNNYFIASLIGLVALVPIMTTHRYLTHQWYVAVFVCLAVTYSLGFDFGLWAFGGYILHLIADKIHFVS